MKKIKRCDVVNEESKVIISGAIVLREVSDNIDCSDSSNIVIKYPRGLDDLITGDNAILEVIPKYNAYFYETEE